MKFNKAEEPKKNFYDLILASINSGEKNLAIGSTGYHQIQSSVLRKVAIRIKNERLDIKLCIVSFNGEDGFVDGYKVLNYGLAELMFFLDQFDYIIWNLPDLEYLKSEEKRFELIFKYIDRFTVLALKPAGINADDFFKYVRSYYMDHGFDGDFVLRSKIDAQKKTKFIDKIVQLLK